jgi:predicted TIM-barrel fold metal-dependent hydrolase
MRAANVQLALMLPTADVDNLSKINRDFIDMASRSPELFTAGTLHPDFSDIEGELSFLSKAAVRVIKLCSFSQGFALNDSKSHRMFDLIQTFNSATKTPFSVVLDTLTFADRYFGSNPEHTTTPQGLTYLARCFPGINFIGAHMGGLGAPFEQLTRHLKVLPNLRLDTSNAAHTLNEEQFIQMLHRHGSGNILFGTDWPWFLHISEIRHIDQLMEKAGFSKQEKEAVFSRNLEKILGINPDAGKDK